MAVTQIKDASSDSQLKVNSDGSINVNSGGGDSTVNSNLNGLNSFQTSGYTVGTTVQQLASPALVNRSCVSVKAICTGQDSVFIGNNNNITTTPGSTSGYPLYNGDSIQLDLTSLGVIWAVATSSGQILYVMEIA